MRCVSSRLRTAAPRFSAASISSGEAVRIDFSVRARAASMTQRMASVWRRVRAHFDRHLVGGAADAAGLHLDRGLHVVERLRQQLDGIGGLAAGLLADAVDGTVEMRSAADFLPSCMTTFMNLASMSLLNFGSGRMVRLGAARRDMWIPFGWLLVR